jgi:hypothetical protein
MTLDSPAQPPYSYSAFLKLHCKPMAKTDALRTRIQDRLAEQRAVVLSLLELREQLQGSLFARYGECGKEGCACRQGTRHGPYYVLSHRSGGAGRFAYLTAEQADAARDLVARARAFRKGMRRLKKVNEEVLVLLRRYQESMARQGDRRLGLRVSV